jgi:hypothetical protein
VTGFVSEVSHDVSSFLHQVTMATYTHIKAVLPDTSMYEIRDSLCCKKLKAISVEVVEAFMVARG